MPFVCLFVFYLMLNITFKKIEHREGEGSRI